MDDSKTAIPDSEKIHMFRTERHAQIIAYIEKHNRASVQELSAYLYASQSTIRRDLSELEKQGILKRTHGGAILTAGNNYDTPAVLRRCQNLIEKERIADIAEQFLAPSTSYFFDSSTTSAILASRAVNYPQTRIATNGLEIPSALRECADVSVILCGGELRTPWGEFTGSVTLRTIEDMYADTFFFSCGGFSLERGATEFRDENVAVKAAFLKNSKQHILLCDSTKFDKLFFYGSIRLEDIDYVITDKRPDDAYVELLGDKLLL